MSTTEIYLIGTANENVGSTRNARRGAMYVWNQIAKKYFDLDNFPFFDDDGIHKKIWNAHDYAELTDDEIIVLASTMDKAVVSKEGLPDLIDAFKTYGKDNDASSFSEQAEILSGLELRDGEFVAWQQTSCGDFWCELYDEPDEDGEPSYYNPNNEGNYIHFDVIEQYRDIKAEKS